MKRRNLCHTASMYTLPIFQALVKNLLIHTRFFRFSVNDGAQLLHTGLWFSYFSFAPVNYVPQTKFGNILFLLCFLLRSSVSHGRPYSYCTVSSSYYLFPLFLSGRFLRDDWMDLLEIFRVDVIYFGVYIFVVSLKKSLSVAKYGRFPSFKKKKLSVNVLKNGYR